MNDTDKLKNNCNNIFKSASKSTSNVEYERVIFINNAGSLGPLTYIGTQTTDENLTNMTSAFNFIITSSCFLSSEVVKLHTMGLLNSNSLVIVNVSSLAAIQPFESWGIYCAGKAARDMFHQVIAKEHENDKSFRVFNYAPGPLDTDMQQEIRECPTLHPETQEYFCSLKTENKLVKVSESAQKLVRIIMQEKYTSGSHVDFYDIIPDMCNKVDCTCDVMCTNSDCVCSASPCTGCGRTDCPCGPTCSCGVGTCNCVSTSITKAGVTPCTGCGRTDCPCGPSCSCGVGTCDCVSTLKSV